MNILITGGTGSFGQAFVQRMLGKCERLVIFSRDEKKQWEMAERFPAEKHGELRYFIGDVRDRERLGMAMYGIDTVIHAAALKHVPIAEYNPFECIRTNVGGAENVVRAAMQEGVGKVIALSSDKAVAPVNLYGASKLAADKIFVAANPISRGARFAVVRYGNVVGSRGSVVEVYRALVERGDTHLPLTDPRMTRFWLTLEQGVEFVLKSLLDMKGGEIFVPRIPSMSMVEVAKSICPDCTFRIVGIRPGEKIHEVLVTEDEGRTVAEPDRYVINPPWNNVGGPIRFASDKNARWLSREEFRSLAGLDVRPANGGAITGPLVEGGWSWRTLSDGTVLAIPPPPQSPPDDDDEQSQEPERQDTYYGRDIG